LRRISRRLPDKRSRDDIRVTNVSYPSHLAALIVAFWHGPRARN
jgi:hypothetical protein